MKKSHNRKRLNEIHARPLPLVLSGEVYNICIPHVLPHNPLSLLYLCCQVLYCNIFRAVPTEASIAVEADGSVFKVRHEDDMRLLWTHGFFGKGTLSRSEPTWKERYLEKLDNNQLSMEQVTSQRRLERKRFKSERAKLQLLDSNDRAGVLTLQERQERDALRAVVNDLRNALFEGVSTSSPAQVIGNVSLDEKHFESELEIVQLDPSEAFFLRFALERIDIIIKGRVLNLDEIFSYCCKLHGPLVPQNKFVMDYIVYHHFRSLGWCVRLGIKFGSDMLLYKRGPPFSHAEYAVMVVPNDESKQSWLSMATLARVVGTVKKSLVLVYVDCPTPEQFSLILESHEDERERYTALISAYSVQEVLYKRWAPSRTRD